jgi:hypothetical protein
MGKPIAKIGHLPYNIGGFCVTAANVNGELKYNLNILQQRSSNVFDLIDTDFNVYTFVSLTSYDKNNMQLDPSKTATELAALLPKNSFVITVDSIDTITAFQSNKIKLNSGAMKFKPWDLYYCNINPDGNDPFDPTLSSITVLDNNAYVNDELNCVVLQLYRKSGLPYVVDRSKLIFNVLSGSAILDSVSSDMGEYTLYYKSAVAGTSTISVKINQLDTFTADINFRAYGVIPDPANSNITTYENSTYGLYADGEMSGKINVLLRDEKMYPVEHYDISKINLFIESTTGDASSAIISVYDGSNGEGGLYEYGMTVTVPGDYYVGCTIDGVSPVVMNNILTYDAPLNYTVAIDDMIGVTYGTNTPITARLTPSNTLAIGEWSSSTPGVSVSSDSTGTGGINNGVVYTQMVGEFDVKFVSTIPNKVITTKTFISEAQKNIVPVSGIDENMRIIPNQRFSIRINMVPDGVYIPTGTISGLSSEFTDRVDIVDYDGEFTYTMRAKGTQFFTDTPVSGTTEVKYENYLMPGSMAYNFSDKSGNF